MADRTTASGKVLAMVFKLFDTAGAERFGRAMAAPVLAEWLTLRL